MNQRRFAVYFFIFTIFLSVFIVLWIFVLNKGTLSIIGDAPFTVTVGEYRNETCDISPCVFTLPPKKYLFEANKNGFFQLSQEVRVKRGKTIDVPLEFRFVPKLIEVGAFALPSKLKKIPNNFTGVEVSSELIKLLEKIPAGAKEIRFGNSSDLNAIVFLGQETYVAGIDKSGNSFLLKTAFKESQAPVYVNDKVATLETEEGEQKLYLYPIADAAPAVITVFKRPLTAPKMIASPSGVYVLVIETPAAAGEKSAYLVDINKKSRNKLPLPIVFIDARFIDDQHILYSEKEKFTVLTIESGEKTELPLISMQTIAPYENKFMIVTTKDFTENKSTTSNIAFTEILEKTAPESIADIITPIIPVIPAYYIVSWDPEGGGTAAAGPHSYQPLVSIPSSDGGNITRFTADVSSKQISLVKEDKVFAVMLDGSTGSP